MTTATGEYAHLPPRFSSLSIADTAPALPREELPAENNSGGAPPAARQAWRSPPGRGEAVFISAEEPGSSSSSSWPAPSRDGAHGRKKLPQQRFQEATAKTESPPSSPAESATSGDPVALATDPRQQQQVEKREEPRRGYEAAALGAPRGDVPPPVGNSNPRASRPPLLPVPRQQQGRPPHNGRRGRGPFHHHNNGDYSGNGNSSNHQQRRPRQHWNAVFVNQRPAQFATENFYRPMHHPMMGFPSVPPDWGFNAMSMPQWGPNPHLAPPFMGTLTPPVGPRFPEVFPYPGHPLSPIPPPVWNAPWFVTPLPGPPEATMQSQPQTPTGNTQREGEDVGVRLRKQIEYYFSDENLMKDMYLRERMDDQGWVSVQIIANFPRVRSLTRDVRLVLGALQTSDAVEVSVDKMRRRGEWSKWIIRQHLSNANQEPPEG